MAENENIEVNPTIELEDRVDMGSTASEYNAEAWAVGERGGVPVTQDDQTWHNNSKYYAEQAAGSAQTASENATAAQGYASTAAGAVQPTQNAQAAAEEAAQLAIDTVVAAQGPGIVYMSAAGEFFVLVDDT